MIHAMLVWDAVPCPRGWYHPRLTSDCQVAVKLAAVRCCHSCRALSWCTSSLYGTRTTPGAARPPRTDGGVRPRCGTALVRS
eukprot:1364564-Prymnesium_polylepis.1